MHSDSLTENSRQTCYFAVGVFDGMTNNEPERGIVIGSSIHPVECNGPAARENLSTCHDDNSIEHGDATHLQRYQVYDEGIAL